MRSSAPTSRTTPTSSGSLFRAAALTAVVVALAGCSDGTGPDAPPPLDVDVVATLPTGLSTATGMEADSAGTVWIVTDEGEVAALSGGSIEVVPHATLGLDGPIDAFTVDSEGIPLASAGTRLVEHRSGAWSPVDVELPARARLIARTPNGSILVAAGEGADTRVWTFRDDEWTERVLAPEVFSTRVTHVLTRGESDFLLIADDFQDGETQLIEIWSDVTVGVTLYDGHPPAEVRDVAFRLGRVAYARGEVQNGTPNGGIALRGDEGPGTRLWPARLVGLSDVVLAVDAAGASLWYSSAGPSEPGCTDCRPGVGFWDGVGRPRAASPADTDAITAGAALVAIVAESEDAALVLDAVGRRVLRVRR